MKCAPVQEDLFKVMFRDLVAKGHELVLLRDAIDWSRFERAFAPAYSDGNGRSSIPVRMMGEFFEHEPPADQATMSRWRSRAGEAGAQEMAHASLFVPSGGGGWFCRLHRTARPSGCG